ncbi:MAG TPA: hypothetical protein VEX60_09490 [Pyrinomonadaceae bacterium]|nr:hypothetical protein [Pyrinomonadaceae bacterium]
MFDFASRYYLIETAFYTAPDGRTLSYKRRRFLPSSAGMQIIAEALVTEGDRLDLVTARTLGRGEHFWRVADANDAMNPFALTAPEEVGNRLRIPNPTA